MNELQKLYDVLVREGKYTKSFDDFQQKWSQEEAYRDKVYGVVSRDGLYTKDKNSFLQKYSASAETPVASTVKKKEPTQQAGALGAMPSRSASSGNLQEMLAAAPPLPADARVDVPIGGVAPRRQAEQQITTAPIVPQQIQERASEIDISQYMDTTPEEFIPALESIKNTFSNIPTALEALPPKVTLAAAGIWKGLLGEDLANELLYNREGRNVAVEQMIASGQIDEISGRMKETVRLTDAIPEGDVPRIAAGIINAMAGMIVPAVETATSFGSLLALDMTGSFIKDYNKEVAGQIGVSEESLYLNNQDAVGVPMVLGSLAFASEKFGLKGVGDYIKKSAAKEGSKKLAMFLLTSNKEGMTELFQTGLEKFNEEYAKTNDTEKSAKAFYDGITSSDGLESYLMGFAGGAGASLAGSAVVNLADKIKAGKQVEQTEIADLVAKNNETNGFVGELVEAASTLGEITPEQRDAVMADMEAMAAAFDKVPAEFAGKAAQLAPIILEKQGIDAAIAEKTIEKAQVDEAFHAAIDEQITALEAQKQALNEQIQAVITPQAQQQVTEAGEVASPVAAPAGAVVEGVQEGGVDTRIANSPLAEVVNKRGVITDANGNLVEGDVYVDGERVVLEAGGRIYDTLGSIDELSQMTAEQLPVQVVAPRITATEGGFTYNSDAGVMPQGTRITPQGKGLKAVKRDKNGNVKSVVVKDDAGNTFNLKGEDAQAMAFELMMDEISKGNLDAKIVLNDEAATAINTAGRPATTQATDSGATQADATRQGAAAPTTATERGDGGRGSRVEATQETEVDNVAQKASISPKNLRDLYKVNRELFGLNRVQSLASSIAMDRMIGTMANRAGISKSAMYGRLKFEKASETNVPQGVLLQVDAWHGSPYQFDKFTTEKIGTGEGAQAFGWGLYFTDLEGIARSYAKELAITTFKGEKIDDVAFFEKLLSGLDANDESFYNPDKGTITNLTKFRQYIKDSIEFLEQSIPNINAENKKYQNLADRYTYQNLNVSDLKSDIDIYKHFEKVANESSDKDDMVNKALPLFKAKADAAKKMLLEVSRGRKNKDEILKSIIDYDLRRAKSSLNYYKYINNNFEKFNISRNLYKVSLQKGKTPDQYTWLEWDKQIGRAKIRIFIDTLSKSSENFKNLYANNYISELENGLYDDLTGEDFYTGLAKSALQKIGKRTEKDVSLALLESGIDGVKYPAESISRGATSDSARGFNYVVFDENAVSIEEVIKFQKDAEKARGAVMVGMDGQAVIYALTDPNVSTPLHELAHVYEHYLTDAERSEVQKWAKTKGWTTETSEKFARGFEKYLSEGNAPTNALQKIFEQFKQWLGEIYNGINDSDIDVKINAKMKSIYDNMFGKDAKTEKVGGKDAAKEPSTKGVDARKQAEDGEGVGKEDSKRKEAAQEGEVADKPKTPKERLAESRERKKAAIDVLKKQWENAKNTGISTDFEQRLKDDKAFFGAVRDIIQSNIEIGALKITDSLNDIADALGIKLSKADKDAVKGVFNKEVLRSLKSAQAEMFETEVVRDALSEYIEENKQVLKGAANAQALKLVNEASTEGGFNRALKYIDKLINNTEFREAVAAATDATKPSNVRPALTELSVARSIIDFFAGLKVTALEDVSLMQRLATILKAPGSVNIREITQLAEDVQKYLSEKQKDALPTQSEVEKSVEGLLVRREKDADGNMQSVSKEFDTARKISNLAKKIAEVEANIYRLGLEPDAQEAMLKSLDAAKRLVETKQSDLAEAIESFRASNIASAKETITKIAKNVVAVSERAKEALGLNAISQRLSELDSLSFYESERLINGLEQIANGYTPLGFFKAVATPIINKPQVQAATLLQNQATALQKKIAKEFADNGGIIGSVRKIFDRIRFGKEAVTGGVKQADVRKATGNMAIAGLVNIDQMYKMAIKSPVLKGFWLPLRKAMVAYRTDLTQTIRSFEKEAGAGLWTRIKGNTSLLADSQIKSNIKVGAALAQASENAYRAKFNILQEQNNFFNNKADQETGVSRIHIESVRQLAKQYPNGVTYNDLTPREKKVYDAFRNLVDNNLEAKQNMANISAGTPFEALQNYFPFIPSTNVKMFEQVGTKETDTAIKSLMAAKGDATKKAKIKSDRGLQRNMDADFYPIELDVFSAARISAAQTLKQYHLEPTLYTAKRAINQVVTETGGAVSAALSNVYDAEVTTQLSSSRDPLARGASGALNLLTAQKLGSLRRIPPEIISGLFGFTYVTGKYTRGSITFSPAVTERLNEEFGASLLQAKGIKDVTDTVQKAKDLVERLRSPDALNEGFWGNAAFAYSLRQKFKEATGKDLEYSKLLDDDYIEANRKDIQAAYDAAIIGNVLYDNSNVGQSLAVRFPFFGAILRKDKGELNRVANQYAMSFGRYAAKIGNNLASTISAKSLPDTEFSDPVTNKEVARKLLSTVAQGVAYQYAADAAIMGIKYGWTALKEGLSDDDEEQKELEEARARLWDEYLIETFSAEKVALTATGSLMYFGLGMYGSFGKAMIYLSAHAAGKALDIMYGNDKTITKAEFDGAKKNLNNVLVSTTYMQMPRNEKEFEANLLLVASGGGKFVVSETNNIGSSMADFFTDVASGDVDATNALYSIGTIYNATLGKKMQVPFPYLEDIGKASRSVAAATETSSPEDISKAFKKDKQKADRLINTYAQRTFIDETKGNSNALEENEELLRKALKAAGFAEDDINDKAELFEDRYNRSKMPLYLYKIINEKSPQASAGMAAENFISFANDLEKATKKGDAEKIRIAEEQILVLRSTLRDKKMPRKGAKGDDRKAFRTEFVKKLSESGIEY